MKKQSGSALVVVLSLLTVSLMIGLSSMQSSQVDELLAGNYKAQSVAQMAAETGASQSIEELSQAVIDGLNLAGITECGTGRDFVVENDVGSTPGSVTYALYVCRDGGVSGVYDIYSDGRVFSSGDVIAIRSVKMRAFELGADFLGLSPITVPSGIKDDASKDDPCYAGQKGNTGPFCFEPADSQVELVGEEIVDGVYNPAITVASEYDKTNVDAAISKREDNYKGGVEAGMSESILQEENLAVFEQFISEVESCAKNLSGSGCEDGESRFFGTSDEVDFGAKGAEKLTFYDGDLSAGGNFSGAGVLVVNGNVSFSGTPNYSGLIIVLGTYSVGGGGSTEGQGGFEGSIVSAPYSADENGELSYEDTSISISGGGSADYVYSVDALTEAFKLIGNAADYWNAQNTSSRKTGELVPDYKGWEDL